MLKLLKHLCAFIPFMIKDQSFFDPLNSRVSNDPIFKGVLRLFQCCCIYRFSSAED